MKTYIGCELIEAKAMTRGDYNDFRGWKLQKNENPTDEGYLVKHNDSYVRWIPKDIFEKYYFGLASNKYELLEDLNFLDEIDIENFKGEGFKERINQYTDKIGFHLGGTYTIVSNTTSFQEWKRIIIEQEHLARNMFDMLLELAVYGFNYKKGVEDNEKTKSKK